MTSLPEYEDHDALGLAALVASGGVSPLELVDEAVTRMERHAGLNAIVARYDTEARRQAAAELPDGPFRGVPYLLKDLATEAGYRTSFGSVFFREFVADQTHEMVARTRSAGFVIVGRSATPEFGLLPTTEPVLHGVTHNPWDPGRSIGGSSGGAAAAVAARIVPMAHASDGGGSIRIPAANAGLFGMKPSRGRNPQRPLAGADFLGVDHAVTRTVRDSAALLDWTSGPVPGDLYWAPPPERPYVEAVERDPRPLRVAVTTRDFRGEPVHPDCAVAVRDAAELMASLGHHVDEVMPAIDHEAFSDAFLLVWSSIPAGIFDLVARGVRERLAGRLLLTILGRRLGLEAVFRLEERRAGAPAFEPFTRALVAHARKHTTADLWTARATLQHAAYQAAEFFEHHDVLLSPVLGAPPAPVGTFAGDRPLDEIVDDLTSYVAFTPIANVTGFPAMSLPLHWNRDGLPIGVQVMGGHASESTLFALAGQVERARPWRDRRPPAAS